MKDYEEGEIVKVSGPVIEARGMAGTEMYEVVKIGELGLFGEVIELDDDKATIQCYEETSGVGPGGKVKRTGDPLSVELGPGLINSIFDGIQRPLNRVREEGGDFIERGVDVPSLEYDKEWEFSPTVTKGDEVSKLDILGTVQETEVLEHKVMVPPGKNGEIIDINKGKLTLQDPVATVEKEDGKEEKIKMLQKWPVREQRPYSEKLDPDLPLVTGQRVLDTFFPLTKGGTAAVPGGFGTGKCVVGKTSVLLSTGATKPIKEIYENKKDEGEREVKENEEWTRLNNPVGILSMEDGKLAERKATHVYKGKTTRTVLIKTRSGREVELTPVHKLFVLTPEMEIEEKMAREIEEEDTLLVPRNLPIEGRSRKIKPKELIPEKRVCGKDFDEVKDAIEELEKEYGSRKELSDELGISYEVLTEYALGRNRPKIGIASKILDMAGIDYDIRRVKGERQSKKIKLPQEIDEKFAELFGLLLGDGSLKPTSVHFYNNDKKLLNKVENLVDELFDVETERKYANTVESVKVNSKTMRDLLISLGFPQKEKSKNCYIPEKILKSTSSVLSAFLRGYYLADGGFNRFSVEISTSSKRMSENLVYALSRIGVFSKLRSKETKTSKSYRIKVVGEELEKFYENTSTNHEKYEKIKKYISESDNHFKGTDAVNISPEIVMEKFKESGEPRKEFKDKGIKIANYTTQKEKMSVPLLQRFSSLADDKELQKVATNHLNHFLPDPVRSIEIKEKEKDVYDLVVPETHNFVGGNIPMILHNTVLQHQVSKWADADVIIFIGCGERGNEMAEVLEEFPELEDPRTGESLMKRTILIANTSNMPVAARESSIYTGITLAEYYRDMGYDVALQADSTSRWAEALREISGRLEEMPGEEGYPAYLASRLAGFYERAGYVRQGDRKGSVSVVGAVSPPGGDFSEPVTQNTLRIVKVFWALSTELKDRRHFPAIDWLESYSLYTDEVEDWWEKEVDQDWLDLRNRALELLDKEEELQEVVQLVGPDALPESERVILEVTKMIREDFLQQNAFHDVDTYCSPEKQIDMLDIVLKFYEEASEAVEAGISADEIGKMKIKDKLARMKNIPEDEFDQKSDQIKKEMKEEIENLK